MKVQLTGAILLAIFMLFDKYLCEIIRKPAKQMKKCLFIDIWFGCIVHWGQDNLSPLK